MKKVYELGEICLIVDKLINDVNGRFIDLKKKGHTDISVYDAHRLGYELSGIFDMCKELGMLEHMKRIFYLMCDIQNWA